jgi:hypothetical protein
MNDRTHSEESIRAIMEMSETISDDGREVTLQSGGGIQVSFAIRGEHPLVDPWRVIRGEIAEAPRRGRTPKGRLYATALVRCDDGELAGLRAFQKMKRAGLLALPAGCRVRAVATPDSDGCYRLGVIDRL